MEQEYKFTLEQSRDDKIKTLGFLCYNLYVDGVMVFPEMNNVVEDIKTTLEYLLKLRQSKADEGLVISQETHLNETLIELGCICYNLYVDSKLFNNKVLSLCDSISSINYEINNGWAFAHSYSYSDNNVEHREKHRNRKGITESKLKVNRPYGMEPIPVNFKRCSCGYRNKSEAHFCGKCGAKLS